MSIHARNYTKSKFSVIEGTKNGTLAGFSSIFSPEWSLEPVCGHYALIGHYKFGTSYKYTFLSKNPLFFSDFMV